MKLSIIVPTYNRKKELEELLDSFTHQTLAPDQFEIIVVDDGSADGTKDYITEARRHFPFPVRYEYQDNSGPGFARTRGMQVASGDVFLFIDSDCIAPPHYLKTVQEAFLAGDIDAFGGPDKTADYFSAWDKAVNYTMTSFMTTGGLRGSSGKKLARYYPRSFNMGFKREVYGKIGGFGSLYHYGEDIEFSHRIFKSGARVVFLEGAYVYHKRRSSPAAFSKQMYKMGKARVQLRKIDRAMFEPLHALPALFVILFAAVFIASAVTSVGRHILTGIVSAALIICLLLIIISFRSFTKGQPNNYRIKKAVKASALVPVAFCLQICAYGCGMIIEGARTFLKRK